MFMNSYRVIELELKIRGNKFVVFVETNLNSQLCAI